MSEWEEYTVEELIEQGIIEKPLDGNHGGIHPKGSDFVDSGIPFIMASDIINGRVDYTSCKFITKDQAQKLRKGFSKEGDVLITHKATIGRTAIVGEIETEYIVLTPQVTYYRVKDFERLDPRYLCAYFNSKGFQHTLNQWSGGGSTRSYLGITGQLKLPIVLAPLPEQKAIAKILGDLDAKIELNRKMNQTLEAMAQTLFQSWFVDFDPVLDNAIAAGNTIPEELKAKAAKRSLVSEDKKLRTVQPELAKLFPNRFVYNEELEKWIPEGWEVKILGEIAEVRTGFPFKSREYSTDEGIRVVRGENVSLGFLRWDSDKKWSKGFEQLENYWLKKYDVVIGMDGSRVGRNRSFVHEHELPLLLAQRVACITAKVDFGQPFLGQLVLGSQFERYVENVKTGTSIPHISGGQIKNFSALVPLNSLAKEYSNIFEVWLDKISQIKLETQSLTQLRDTLLPQLISGKLKVPEALLKVEQAVE